MNDNTRLALRWFDEIWNQRRIETARELLTDESISRSEGGELRGFDGFVELHYTPLVSTFPDLRVTIDAAISEGDEVAVRWTASGTHSGDGMGMAPSGRRFSIRGMTWMRCRDGKLLEGWDSWNQAGFLQALQGGPVPASMTLT